MSRSHRGEEYILHFAKWENPPTNTCWYNLCIPTKIFLALSLWLLSQWLVKSICKCYFQHLCRILVMCQLLVSHNMWQRIKLHQNTLWSIEITNHQSTIFLVKVLLQIHYIENVFSLLPLCLPGFRWNIPALDETFIKKERRKCPWIWTFGRIWLFRTVWCMMYAILFSCRHLFETVYHFIQSLSPFRMSHVSRGSNLFAIFYKKFWVDGAGAGAALRHVYHYKHSVGRSRDENKAFCAVLYWLVLGCDEWWWVIWSLMVAHGNAPRTWHNFPPPPDRGAQSQRCFLWWQFAFTTFSTIERTRM